MTATAATPTAATPSSVVSAPDRARVWRAGLAAGVVAAIATTAVAAAARAADVPLEVAHERIPMAGYAQMTLLGALLGIAIAKGCLRWSSRPARAFVTITVVLTLLTLVPDVVADATTATKLVLVATHAVAALIVVPVLAGRVRAARVR